jgi:8-oxo-dGTP diphosphatase
VTIDQLDVVREYYRAINRRDLDAVAAAYAEDCVTESIAPHVEGGIQRGRAATRRILEELFAGHDGALEAGAFFRVRTVAGIESGWGWVHAEWIEGHRPRPDGAARYRAGYSHFLVEDGLIRRHRSVAQPIEGVGEGAAGRLGGLPEERPSSRSYPSRPIVGVGAVVFSGGRVVLIKRRNEPLAGQWSLPGGTLELGETLEAGIAREVLEETGLEVDVGPVVEVFDRILLDERQQIRFHFVLIDYLCRATGGVLAHGSDVADVTLADPADLDGYELTPKAAGVIRRAVRMRGAPQTSTAGPAS